MEPVQVNKWVRFGLTMFTGLLASMIAYPWQNLVDVRTAGIIVVAVTTVKGVIDLFAPGAGVPTVPSGSSTSLITHRAVRQP